LRVAGATVEVAAGIDQALATLEGWGILSGRAANHAALGGQVIRRSDRENTIIEAQEVESSEEG